MRGGSTVCHTGDVGHRFAMTFLGVRGKRVVGDADPYEVGKNPVGRGLCAPPENMHIVRRDTWVPPYRTGAINRP